MLNFRFLLVSSLCLAIISCKNDDQEQRKLIVGTWDVYASEMNGNANGMMKDAYFVFAADNSVKSNTLSENESSPYSGHNGQLEIKGIENFNMKIIKLTPDTLWLKGQLSHYNMKFFMSKRR